MNDELIEPRYVTQALTEREIQLLQGAANGFENAEMARALRISLGAVRESMYHINIKLHTTNRTQAVVYAWRRRWIT